MVDNGRPCSSLPRCRRPPPAPSQDLCAALGGFPHLLGQTGPLPLGADEEAPRPHQGDLALRRGARPGAQEGTASLPSILPIAPQDPPPFCPMCFPPQSKEEVSGTLEAVQMLHGVAQLLPKSKESYHSKCQEYERLRKEGTSQKEIDKVDPAACPWPHHGDPGPWPTTEGGSFPSPGPAGRAQVQEGRRGAAQGGGQVQRCPRRLRAEDAGLGHGGWHRSPWGPFSPWGPATPAEPHALVMPTLLSPSSC